MVKTLAVLLLSLLAACGHTSGDGSSAADDYKEAVDDATKAIDTIDGVLHALPHAQLAQAQTPAIASIKDGEFLDGGGRPVALQGSSYFGFNVNGCCHGLWSNDPIGNDFARIVQRQKMLGLNAVRLPFSFALFKDAAQSFATDCQDVTKDDIAKATLDPEVQGADLASAPALTADAPRKPGRCNDYLPSGTVRKRFLWVVKFYLDNGFYVLLDNHLREDNTAIDNFQAWVEGWKALVHDVDAMPGSRGRVLLDLLNEPGQKGLAWDKLGPMYLTAMDAIWEVSQAFPFALEGTGQDATGANWGDGFVTSVDILDKGGISDPRPFFTNLAGKPYASWTALAPHVYGPAVTTAPDRFSGAPLWDRLDASFGLLQAKGVSLGDKSLRLPVLIGEFGSKFEDPRDVTFMKDFASYLTHTGDVAKRPSGVLRNWFYWDWNADSGDTGGLVKDNWRDIEWEKVRYLETLGLSPWYRTNAGAAAATPTPPSATPSSTPAKSSSSTPAPTSSSPGRSSPAPKPAPAPAAQPAPPAAKPEPVKQASIPAPPPPSPASSDTANVGHCQVKASEDGTWTQDGKKYATVNLFFTAGDGEGTKVPFKLSLLNSDYTELVQAWNLDEAKLEGKQIVGMVNATWASVVPGPQNIVNIGYIVAGSSADLLPKEVRINDEVCTLKLKGTN